jgi:transposase
MAAYSMDLRERVFEDRRDGLSSKEVAAKYRVSRAWVNRLMQRHRETGKLVPRQQTKFRAQALAGQETQLRALVDAQPDRTLVEIREALRTSASISAIWRALDRLGITVKKNGSRRRTTARRRRH